MPAEGATPPATSADRRGQRPTTGTATRVRSHSRRCRPRGRRRHESIPSAEGKGTRNATACDQGRAPSGHLRQGDQRRSALMVAVVDAWGGISSCTNLRRTGTPHARASTKGCPPGPNKRRTRESDTMSEEANDERKAAAQGVLPVVEQSELSRGRVMSRAGGHRALGRLRTDGYRGSGRWQGDRLAAYPREKTLSIPLDVSAGPRIRDVPDSNDLQHIAERPIDTIGPSGAHLPVGKGSSEIELRTDQGLGLRSDLPGAHADDWNDRVAQRPLRRYAGGRHRVQRGDRAGVPVEQYGLDRAVDGDARSAGRRNRGEGGARSPRGQPGGRRAATAGLAVARGKT